MFQEEAVALLQKHEGTLLWQEGLLQLFHYIEENKAVCLCALNSVGRDHLKRFFEADIHAIIHRAVEQIGNEVGAVQAGVTQDDIALMTHIYVVASAGVIESWLLGEIDRTPEELIKFADKMLQDHINGARLRWQAECKHTFTGATKGADSVKVDLSAEDEDIENLEAFAEKISEALA